MAPDPLDGATSTATITPTTDAAAQSTLTALGRSPKNITDTGSATTGPSAAMINAVAMLTVSMAMKNTQMLRPNSTPASARTPEVAATRPTLRDGHDHQQHRARRSTSARTTGPHPTHASTCPTPRRTTRTWWRRAPRRPRRVRRFCGSTTESSLAWLSGRTPAGRMGWWLRAHASRGASGADLHLQA